MRILFDHCMNRRFARELPMHEIRTAASMGWAADKNGRLMALAAAAGFEVLVTVDQNLRHQQKIEALPLTVLEMHAPSIALPTLRQMAPYVIDALADAAAYRCIVVYLDGRIERFAPRA